MEQIGNEGCYKMGHSIICTAQLVCYSGLNVRLKIQLRMFAVKHTGKQLLRNVRCEDNIKMQLTEVGYMRVWTGLN
jgi:hypothetical protein